MDDPAPLGIPEHTVTATPARNGTEGCPSQDAVRSPMMNPGDAGAVACRVAVQPCDVTVAVVDPEAVAPVNGFMVGVRLNAAGMEMLAAEHASGASGRSCRVAVSVAL